MATGYETRTKGRDTFASQGPAVERIGGRVALSGESQGAQIVGGQAQGGSDHIQITEPGNSAGDLGQFFAKAVEPYLQRVQQQKFFEGMTRAQAGESIAELSHSHKNIVGKLFGPTPLEQGAQFYTASKTVDDWHSSLYADMDRLKQMTPTDLSKELAAKSTALMGDDPFVNQLVQKQLIEKSGPLVDAVAKERYIWQQNEAGNAMFGALDSSANVFQQAAKANAAVTDPTDAETASYSTSMASFLGSMQKPEGMSDDMYRKTLKRSLISMAQNGNFYGYHALEKAGVFNALDAEDQKPIQDAYDRYSGKALDDAKGSEQHIQELMAVREGMEKRGLNLPGGLSPLEAVAKVDAINAAISRETGVQTRAYDASYLTSTGTSVIDMIAADARAQQARTQSKADRAEEKAADEADDSANAATNYSAALGAFNLGQPVAFLRSGGDHAAVDRVFWDGYRTKHFGKIIQSFTHEGYVDSAVAKKMQAKANSGQGQAYTGEVKEAYGEWQYFMQRDKGAALAYYGADIHGKMLRMNSLLQADTPATAAYQVAFGDDGTGSRGVLRPQDRKEVGKAVAAQVASQANNWLGKVGLGVRPMGDHAKSVLSGAITNMTATLQATSHQAPAELAESAAKAAHANGSYEWYGADMAWTNQPGTKPISDFVRLSPKATGDILYKEINDRMEQVGNKSTSYQILRTPAGNQGFVLTIIPQSGVPINITGPELRARADKEARGDLTKAQHGPSRAMPGVGTPL